MLTCLIQFTISACFAIALPSLYSLSAIRDLRLFIVANKAISVAQGLPRGGEARGGGGVEGVRVGRWGSGGCQQAVDIDMCLTKSRLTGGVKK